MGFEEIVMQQVERLDTKIDKIDDKIDKKLECLTTSINTLTTEIKVSNQQNTDEHKDFDNRISKAESDASTSRRIFQEFLNSPILLKASIIIVFLLITGASGITIADLVGLI